MDLKKHHFTCPMCGRRAAQSVLSAAFPFEFWEQEFGWFRGQPKPTMKWTLLTDSNRVRLIRELLLTKLAAIAARFGYRLVPIDIEVSILQKPESDNLRTRGSNFHNRHSRGDNQMSDENQVKPKAPQSNSVEQRPEVLS
jgi:hypothetical protein